MRSLTITAALLVLVATFGGVTAQPATAPAAKQDATVLVPPQGGAADVPVHITANVLLTFPSPIAPRVVGSSQDWDVKEFTDGVVVRAKSASASPATLALSTKDGQIKVNVTLRVVPATADALTVVRFQAASAEDAFRAAVDVEVERRTAPIRAELAAAQKALDAKVRDRADRIIAAKLLRRFEQVKLSGHARNDDNVIVHLQRAILLGDDAYVMFDIQNRSGDPYRVAAISLRGAGGKNHAGPASLSTNTIDAQDRDLIGVVPPRSTGSAVVMVRQADAVLGIRLTLTVQQPDGRGRIVLDRGIVLR